MTLTGGPDQGTIAVLDRHGTTLAVVETADFSVTIPADEPAAGGAGFPSIAVIAVVVLVAAGVIALVAIRRRRRRAVAV